jgi:hypothetical protein
MTRSASSGTRRSATVRCAIYTRNLILLWLRRALEPLGRSGANFRLIPKPITRSTRLLVSKNPTARMDIWSHTIRQQPLTPTSGCRNFFIGICIDIWREVLSKRSQIRARWRSPGYGRTGARRGVNGCAASRLSQQRRTGCAPNCTIGCPQCWRQRPGGPGSVRSRRTLLAPYPSEAMMCWPVSARVGNVKNNDPSLIEPIAAQ